MKSQNDTVRRKDYKQNIGQNETESIVILYNRYVQDLTCPQQLRTVTLLSIKHKFDLDTFRLDWKDISSVKRNIFNVPTYVWCWYLNELINHSLTYTLLKLNLLTDFWLKFYTKLFNQWRDTHLLCSVVFILRLFDPAIFLDMETWKACFKMVEKQKKW